MIRKHTIHIEVAGTAGSATGADVSTAPVNGRLLAVYIQYADQPATCNVMVIADVPLLTVSDANTNGQFYPRASAQDNTGSPLSFDGTELVPVEIPLDGYVTAAVSDGDAGSVSVTLVLEQ